MIELGLLALAYFLLKKTPLENVNLSISDTEVSKPILLPMQLNQKQNESLFDNPAVKKILSQGVSFGISAIEGTGIFSSLAQKATTMAGSGMMINPVPIMGEQFTQPYSGYAKIIDNVFPVLGSVVAGFLEGILGDQPETPIQIYNMKTRNFDKGIILGEPFSQFTMAALMWADVQANIRDIIAIENASKFGLSIEKKMSSTLVYVAENNQYVEANAGLDYSQEVKEMVEKIIVEAGGIEKFLNPVETYIMENYKTLFLKESDPILGGPSPYMIYLSSQGI